MNAALVTGAGIRVGRAVALALADLGMDLHLHVNRSVESAEEVAELAREKGVEAFVHVVDLSAPEGPATLAAAVLARTSALSVLVNNAGLFEKIPFADIDAPAYRRMLAVNLDAPFFLTQALLPALRNAENALVVNIGDIAGERPVPGYAHYSVSKAGLLMLTRALAVELAPSIRVNAISPGTVAFPPDFDDDMKKKVLARIPMGREGDVEDIARAVRYLIDAPYVTGQVLDVDGGRGARL